MGTMVLLMEDNIPPFLRMQDRITKNHPDPDEFIRVIANYYMKRDRDRPVQKMAIPITEYPTKLYFISLIDRKGTNGVRNITQ